MHSHSYFKTHLQYKHFNLITLLLIFFFEVTLFVVENCCCKQGKSSCYVYTDTTISFYTWFYYSACSYDWLLLIYLSLFYCLCTAGYKYTVLSIQPTIVVNGEVIKVTWSNWIRFLLIWLITYFWCTQIHTSRLTYSINIFNFSKFLLHFLLWSQNICCWKNCCRKWGESSFYVYTDKIISNSTC